MRQITGLSTATLGSTLSLGGSAPLRDGPVQVEGSYNGGLTWLTLSTVQSYGGTYAAQVPLTERGELALKIVFADGSTAVGSVLVQ